MTWIAQQEARHLLVQDIDPEADADTHSQVAMRLAGEVAYIAEGVVESFKRCLRPLEQDLAGGSELNVAGRSVHQPGAKMSLEPRDAPAYV